MADVVIPYTKDTKDEKVNLRCSPEGFEDLKKVITKGAEILHPGDTVIFKEQTYA